MSSIKNHFKSYLNVGMRYKGGKSIANNGKKSFKLSSNENPIGPSPMAVAAIQKELQDLHIYPDTTDARLRKALVEYYGHSIQDEQLICTASGSEMIDVVCRGFLREGDEVIISNPCFVPYATFSRWSGATIVDVPLKGASYALDVEGILSAITDQTRIIFLTSPNNPTGTYIPADTVSALLDQVPDDVVVIYDEVYWHFVDRPDYIRGYDLLQKYPNVIAINSFSKAFGLASLRVGYGYMHEDVSSYLRQLIRPFLINRTALVGALAALKDVSFIDQTKKAISAGYLQMTAAMDELGIQYTPSVANFILVDPPVEASDFVDHFFDQRIAIRPTDNFGAPGKVRISIGDEEANAAAINAFHSLIRDRK